MEGEVDIQVRASGLGGQLCIAPFRVKAISGISAGARKVAGLVMRASELNALSAASNQVLGAVMFDTIGSLTRKYSTFDKLEADDRKRLQGGGVTNADWAVWRIAEISDLSGLGDTALTHNEIMALTDAQLASLGKQFNTTPGYLRDNAATKLLGVVQDEAQMGTIEPGACERVEARTPSFSTGWGRESHLRHICYRRINVTWRNGYSPE